MVHPKKKNENCVIIYSPLCCSKSVWVPLFYWTQKKVFLKNVGNDIGLIDIDQRGKKYYGSQWVWSTVWLPTFFKISSFVFNRRKKLIQVWNNSRVSKWCHNLHVFGWSVPLKISSLLYPKFSNCSNILNFVEKKRSEILRTRKHPLTYFSPPPNKKTHASRKYISISADHIIV